MVLVTIGNLIAFLLLAAYSYRDVRKLFSRINKRTWTLLLIVFVAGLSLRIIAPWGMKTFIGGSLPLEAGKNLILRGAPELCYYVDISVQECYPYNEMYVLPVLYATLYFLGADGVLPATYLNILISSFTIIIFFFVAYLYSKNEKRALLAASFCSLFPAFIYWASDIKAYTIHLFLMMLTVFFFFCFFRTRKENIFWLATFTLLLAMQTRMESTILPFLVISMFILLKEKPPKLKKKFMILLSAIFFISFAFQLWGHLNLAYRQVNLTSESMTSVAAYYFGGIATGQFYSPILNILAVLGVFALRKQRGIYFLVSWFLLCTVPFIFFGTMREGRLLSGFASIIFLSAFGINVVLETVKSNTLKILITFLVFLSFAPHVYTSMQIDDAAFLETHFPEMLEADIIDNCYIIFASSEKLIQTSVLTGPTDLKVIPTFLVTGKNPELVKKLAFQTDCILYVDDLISDFYETYRYYPGGRYYTVPMDMYDLEPALRYSFGEEEITIYQVKQQLEAPLA